MTLSSSFSYISSTNIEHQPDNIPWHLLASNLRWVPRGSCKCKAANPKPCMKPSQEKDFNLFVREFAKTIEDHAIHERQKYPETYEPPKISMLSSMRRS